MPVPDPRSLINANVGSNIRPRSATRDLRASFARDNEFTAILSSKQMGVTGKFIRVFPASAEFTNIEAGVTHVLSITVMNRSDRARRIRFVEPKTREFVLHQIPTVAVAPGLEVTADLEFFSSEEKDYMDEISVICETDKITIPILAQAPKSEITFDAYCLFGAVPPGRTVIRYLEVVNRGRRAGEFCIVQDDQQPFVIEPLSARLGPAGRDDCSLRVRVSFCSKDLGPYRSVVDVLVDSLPSGLLLDMSALVVRQQFEVVSTDGLGQVSNVQMGTVYVGESRTSQVVLVNDGSDAVEFGVTVDEDLTSTGGDHDIRTLFSLHPSKGTLAAYEQKIITITYSPPVPQQTKGFECQPLYSEEEHAVKAMFVSADGKQQAQIAIKGKAIVPAVVLTEHTLAFVDTPTNGSREIPVSIKNLHEEMPINFAANKIAHFCCRPATGRLLPSQSMQMIVSFRPNQLGAHAGRFCFDLCGASGEVVGQRFLSVSGSCSSEGPRRTLVQGLKATKESFVPVFKFQESDELQHVRSQDHKGFHREKPWNKYPPDVNEQTVMYTYDAAMFETQHANKATYQELLRKGYKERHRIGKLPESRVFALGGPGTACGDPVNDPDYAGRALDMGMFSLPVKGMPPNACLKEPRLELPSAPEPLYLKGGRSEAYIKPKARGIDESKLISKKFKDAPTTLREALECKTVLSAQKILQVSTSTTSLDFGSICIQAEVSKCFAVSNDTGQSLLVSLDTVTNPLLCRSKPESQVIPPGGTAGFDITLYLDTPQEIDTRFSYTLNSNHRFQVRVKASAVPVMLSINKTKLNFTFPSSSCAMFLSETVKLLNPGSNPAEFRIENAGTFTAIPHEGTVEAKGSEEITITFVPGQAQRDEQTLNVVVLGGSNISLLCTGEVDESQIQSKQKILDLGSVAAGCTICKTISLQNVGTCNAVYVIDPESLRTKCPGLSLHPDNGMISPDGTVQIVATLRSQRELKIDSYVVINARGGKPFKLAVKANVLIPEVRVLNDEINFGATSLGSRTSRQISISNGSPITAVFTLDLRKYPEFTVLIPEELEYDDEGDSTDTFKPPQSTTPQIAMDSTIANEAQGAFVKFKIPAESSGTLEMTYAPTSLISHAFELPLTLLGLPSYAAKSLRRVVVTEALKPKLLVSGTVIDFAKQVVVGEKVTDFAYKFNLILTNCDESTMTVDMRLTGIDADAGIFSMAGGVSRLESGKSQTTTFKYCPRTDHEHKCSLQICLDESSVPYLVIPVQGSGVQPNLGFDRREVILPTVPLGYKTTATFFVINQGYDNLNVRYQLSPESALIPISITFPQGTMVGVVKQRLPVQVSFESKKPFSFSLPIDFLDADGKKYTINVLGTSDACYLTTFPFLEVYKNFFEIEFKAGKPIAVQQTKDLKEPMLTSSCTITFENSQEGNMHASQINSVFLCECAVLDNQDTIRTVLEWSNRYLFRQTVLRFPGDLIENRGKNLVDVIESATGKAVTGQNRKISTNKREEAGLLIIQYTELLNFLKSYGAFTSSIKPEYLLGTDLFQRLFMDGKSGMDLEDEHRLFFESYYPMICSGSWMRLLYQIIRLFVFNRISPKLLKSLPGIEASELPPFPTYLGSNLYSVPENIILHWLNHHHSIIFPSEKLNVTNFDSDLQDCRVFSAVVISHIPSTKSVFAEMKKTAEAAAKLKNAKKLYSIVREMGLDYCPPPEILCEAPAHVLILFCVVLFNVLPSFIPKATIEFEGQLNDAVIKHIELANPSSKPLIYTIRIDGSTEFKAENTLKLGPREKILFPVSCFHLFRRDVEAQIFFVSERSSTGATGVNLVFNLRSVVKSYKRSEIIKRTTRLYEPTTIEILAKGLNEETVELSVSLVEIAEPVSETPEMAEGRKRGFKSKNSKKSSLPVTSSPILPSKSFWLKKDKIKLRKGPASTGSLTLNFLPLCFRTHKCLLFIKDELVGEYCIEVQVDVSLPATTESVKFSNPMKNVICKDISLSARNAAIDKCRGSLIELLGQQAGKDFLKVMSEQPIVEYQVQYLSEFFTGPKLVAICSATTAASSALVKAGAVNKLPLELHPKGPGKYEGRIIMRSVLDIRIFDVDIHITFSGNRAELIFNCPVRHSVTQEIPLFNHSDATWNIMASLDAEFFSGPREFAVPPKVNDVPGRSSYPLTFSPRSIMSVQGQLILRNNTIGDNHEYQLSGIGEEPLAEEHIRISCRARWKSAHIICVRNFLENKNITYHVESDLVGLIGSDQISVPAGGEADYEFEVMMPCGGHFHGCITFTSPEDGYIWYTVEVVAENPPAEKAVKLHAVARSAVAASITIANPTDEEISFMIEYEGEGLLGPSVCTLSPKDSTIFEVMYSPLIAGKSRGAVRFINERQGEFWYELDLTCDEAEPVMISDMHSPISSCSFYPIEIENPLGEDIELQQSISNRENFNIALPGFESVYRPLVVEAYGCMTFHIVYTPSAIQEAEETDIILQHPVAGKWVYHCRGVGLHPTIMETHAVSAPVGQSSSNVIVFHNPLKHKISCSVSIIDELNTNAFCLIGPSSENVSVGSGKDLNIPFLFSPTKLMSHKAELVIIFRGADEDISWRYPIVGTAEAAKTVNLGRITCKARESIRDHELRLNLIGAVDVLDVSELKLEIVPDEAHRDMLSRALHVVLDKDSKRASDCKLKINFEPLKQIRSKIEIRVTQQMGGRWKFNLELIATEADIDDVIRIEGLMNVSSSVSFRQCNQFDAAERFRAYFSADSPSEFSVSPASGILQPYGSEGTNFIVTFLPRMYGKIYVGKLVIETEEMQWAYEVRGENPKYEQPAGSAKVAARLPSEQDPG